METDDFAVDEAGMILAGRANTYSDFSKSSISMTSYDLFFVYLGNHGEQKWSTRPVAHYGHRPKVEMTESYVFLSSGRS